MSLFISPFKVWHITHLGKKSAPIPHGGISGTSWTFLTCLAFLGVSKAAKEKAGELNSRQKMQCRKEMSAWAV
jgi:hypothetical protein